MQGFQLFFAFFLIKAPDEGPFHLNGRQGYALLTGNAPKIKDWPRLFIYVRLPTKSSWAFPQGPGPFELNRSDPDTKCTSFQASLQCWADPGLFRSCGLYWILAPCPHQDYPQPKYWVFVILFIAYPLLASSTSLLIFFCY